MPYLLCRTAVRPLTDPRTLQRRRLQAALVVQKKILRRQAKTSGRKAVGWRHYEYHLAVSLDHLASVDNKARAMAGSESLGGAVRKPPATTIRLSTATRTPTRRQTSSINATGCVRHLMANNRLVVAAIRPAAITVLDAICSCWHQDSVRWKVAEVASDAA